MLSYDFIVPAMFWSNNIPTLPDGARTESNQETFDRLKHDLRCSLEGGPTPVD